MEKIEKELNKLFLIVLISAFVFFIVVLFDEEICLYFSIDKFVFSLFLAFVMIWFLSFAFFNIKKSSKKVKKEFDRVVLSKESELREANKELHEANIYLQNQLYEDSLTGLLNRKALERDMATMKSPKLTILDIDSFKEINEYYGNSIGDKVLCSISMMLRGFAEKENLNLYRIGADEFALLEDSELDMDRFENIATALIELFKNEKIEATRTKELIELNVTLGFSFDFENTLEKATVALNEAKQKQRNYLCYFKKIDNKEVYSQQIKWSKFIDKAIEDNRVIPYYQPIFNAEKEVVKHECLVRILDENEEVISPGLFLEIAKKVKRYSEIEKLLIQKSFSMIEHTDNIISINLLARDMSDSDVSNFVVSKLSHYGVSKRIVFEILESENIENLDRVSSFIDRVKRMGCKVAIDDFGTGYSNFSYLTKLKPDYIKIDGSLIKNLGNDENSCAIVSSIITFAKKLGIKTIAEFVHNEEVFEICKDLGIDEFQGFYLGEPSSILL